jgi:hypothetical protein
MVTEPETRVLYNEYDPNRSLALRKEYAKVPTEVRDEWMDAYVVQFLDLFGHLLSFDRVFYDRIAQTIRDAPAEAGLECLSRRDYDYLTDIRTKVYTFSNLAAMRGKTGQDDSTGSSVNVTVNIGQDAVESVEAKRAAAQKLLRDFNASDKYLGEDRQLIEGHVVEGPTD